MPGPQPTAHQVLVYSGPGVSPLSLSYTLLTLSLLLNPHYTVQPVTPEVLAQQPWEPACALLVIPGGRDLPYVEELTTKTRVTKRIRDFVEEGGRYLGICAGAYFGAEEVRFDVGGGLEVAGKRDLGFVPGFCVGPTFPGFAYAAESGSKAVSLTLGEGSSSQKTLDHIYYNGGGHFVIPTPYPANIEILARYAESTPSTPNPIAAVLSRKGKGKALLSSVHAEYPLNDPPARDAIAKLDDVPDQVDLAESESRRIAWMEELLLKLDLKPPGRRKVGSSVEGEEDPNLLLHPTHPSPIFVVSHPSLLRLAPETFNAPAIRNKAMAVEEDGVTVLRDGNDELRISTVDQPDGQNADAVEDLTRYLARRRREQPPQPPTLENLSLDSTTPPAPPPMPDFHIISKSLLLPSTSTPYSSNWTPLFNIETYWKELDMARKRYGRKTGIMRKDESGNERASVGDLLLYGETVTSTQTMLDRNPIILTHLPTPVAFLASFQLSGRGRGSNIWLSPAGCLQFSLLLTLPSSMSSKIVFIQYLMALAVCEAVDDDGRLGVKVKWPNDIYAECEGVGGTEVGSGKKGLAKLGGILVNTNFVNGQWRVVIGTGINVLNALPTTSISQLHSLLAGRSPEHAINPPTMESTFAKIMNAFEIKWEQFVEDKGFSGFMDEYLGRWLHTDKEVTLTTTEPHTKLRIIGITPDYGLLRCLPLSDPAKAPSGLTPLYSRGDFGEDDRSSRNRKIEYVDLQPDGNSFDLMSGMIKRKV